MAAAPQSHPEISVQVPGGFPPGSTFPAQYGGQIFNVTVPEGAIKGDFLQIAVPFEVQEPNYMFVGGQQIE